MAAKQDDIIFDILKIYNTHTHIRTGSDYSVSDLLKPAQIVILEDRHRHELVVDEIEYVLPSIIGNATHNGLQRFLEQKNIISGKYLIERKLLKIVNGKRIAGRFDIYDKTTQCLTEIKVTKVYSFLNGGKEDWTDQLNIYKWMLLDDNIVVDKLQVFMILLDWSPYEARLDSNYPQSRVQVIDIEKKSNDKIKYVVESKVRLLEIAKNDPDNKLPLCYDSERWATKSIFKLFKSPKAKRSYKNFYEQQRAESYLKACQANDKKKQWDKAFVKEVTGDLWKRCNTWCSVSKFCSQYKNKIRN